MEGVLLNSAGSFAETFAPVAGRLDHLFWLFELQSGPFDHLGRADWEQLSTEIEALAVEVDDTSGMSSFLWQPEAVQKFGSLLVHDELGHFFGIEGPIEHARQAAGFLLDAWRKRGLLPAVEEHAAFFAFFAYTHWEVYTMDLSLHRAIAGLPSARPCLRGESCFVNGRE